MFVLALTGALVASRAQLDIVEFVFLACITATAGGTIRDLILDRAGVLTAGARDPDGRDGRGRAHILDGAPLAESRYR